MTSLKKFFNIGEELTSITHSPFKKIEEKGTLPSSFYKASITNVLKPAEDSTKRKTANQYPSQIDIKIFDKLLANRIKQYIKRITHHDYAEFIPGMEGYFYIQKSLKIIHHIRKLRRKI